MASHECVFFPSFYSVLFCFWRFMTQTNKISKLLRILRELWLHLRRLWNSVFVFFYLKTSRKFASFGFFCCIQMRAKHLHFHRIAFCFEFSLIIWFEAMFCSHATQRIDYFICTVFLRRQQWRQQRQTFQFDPKYYRYTARNLNVSSERNHIECDESKLNVT